ncbi:MAG: GNAT family N-acetyltransferase [Oscillospiraceae bacterium]|jgi:ribosomal-protein-alanine N-acetyltransferase|nr:GNAT family N-acetyltransferase [Oscillospiraceae bacterium]
MECPQLNRPDIETLETPRLILRKFEISDAEAMYANWASDPDVTRFMTWPTHQSVDETRGILRRWINEYSDHLAYNWAITLKPAGIPIGSIGTDLHEPLTCNFGYCISKAYWGNGFTAEASRALIAFMFDRIGANRVEATHDPENPNSGRVMQKCGMSCEGTLRQAIFTPYNGIRDKVVYSLLREEYERMRRLNP